MIQNHQWSIVGLFAKFCLAILVVTSIAVLSTAVPLTQRYYDESQSNYIQDISSGYNKIISNYLQDRLTIIQKLAAHPMVVNSLVQRTKGNKELSQFIKYHKILHPDTEIEIDKVNRESIVGSLNIKDRKKISKISKSVLSEKIKNHVMLDGESNRMIIFWPIYLNHKVAGVVIAALQIDFDSLFGENTNSLKAIVAISQGSNIISSSKYSFKTPISVIQDLPLVNLKMHVTVEINAMEKRNEIFLFTLISKVIFLNLFCVLILSIFGYGQLVRPFIELDEKDRALTKTVEGVAKLDEYNMIVFANDALKDIFEQNNLISASIYSFFDERYHQRLSEILDNYSDNVLSINLPVMSNERYVMLKVNVVFINRFTKEKYCFMHDITELTRIERIKNSFVSIVSHELRTPLTSMHGALSLIKSYFSEGLTDKCRELFEICHNNSVRLGVVINDILDVEKIAAGKMSYNFQKTELNTLVDEIVRDCSGYSMKYDIELKLTSLDHPVFCEIDSNRFSQAISNLLSNAAKFSPSKGMVDIKIELLDESSVQISIHDDGRGIPEAIQAKLFSKFTQSEVSEHNKTKGTGLGLYITKSFIDAMDGEISYQSAEGHGTTFFVKFNCTSS